MTEEERILILAKAVKPLDIKTANVKDLAFRLNDLNRVIDDLTIEYNNIVKELWERIPSIREDVDIQLKNRKKIR